MGSMGKKEGGGGVLEKWRGMGLGCGKLYVERERERRKTLILIHVKCALTIERDIYIYTRLGVLTTIHVTYINKER